jgi:hypothetical protein
MSLNFIIEIVFSAFLFIYILVNIRTIALFIFRYLFGNCSFQYVNLYKKYYAKNPFPPCIKEDLKIHCFNFVDKNPGMPLFKTDKTVAFGSFPFYTKFADVKKEFLPNCFNIYKLSEKDTVKIIGRRTEILGIETKELYYFMNDIFFMGEHSFSDVSKTHTKELVGMLSSKYEMAETDSFESFYIQDHNESLISFDNNGFSITIQYINLGKTFINEAWNTYFKSSFSKEIFCRSDIKSIMFAKL